MLGHAQPMPHDENFPSRSSRCALAHSLLRSSQNIRMKRNASHKVLATWPCAQADASL